MLYAPPPATVDTVTITSTPWPGRFCASYEHGVKKKSRFGTLKCARYSDGRWRWKRI